MVARGHIQRGGVITIKGQHNEVPLWYETLGDGSYEYIHGIKLHRTTYECKQNWKKLSKVCSIGYCIVPTSTSWSYYMLSKMSPLGEAEGRVHQKIVLFLKLPVSL